jgi:hypothetical protein
MNQDIEHMQRPSRWFEAVCPLKRDRKQYPDSNVGILMSDEPHVFFMNIWDVHSLNAEDYKGIKGKVYTSHMAMYKDGWRVD